MSEEEVSLVRCGTSAGPFVMEMHRKWSPHGYDRAVALFERGFYDNTHFFRVVPKFLVQFGITYSTDEELKNFADHQISDDPQLDPPIKFKEGTISYAGSGKNSRTSQLFISYGASHFGESPWETPIGQVVEGMENVRSFYSYGDMPPWGEGPVQDKIHSGSKYIEDNFPLSDHFLECVVERDSKKPQSEAHQHKSSKMEEGGSGKVKTMPGEGTNYTAVFAVFFVVGIVAFSIFRMKGKKEAAKSK